MTIRMTTPTVDGLAEVLEILGEWQTDDAPLQLHPGDLGWFWRHGPEATAAATRVWRRDDRIVAIGLLDGPDILRLTTADPDDDDLARRIVADLDDVLPAGTVNVETPSGACVHELLAGQGWNTDELWTPLRRDLADEVQNPDVRIEPARPADWATVIESAFGSTNGEQRYRAMSAGVLHAQTRSLVAYDGAHPVAAITVWSAGRGRPGLVEPMGVHADHRGKGYGRAICLAGAVALKQLGSSSALVCTSSAKVGAVATYASAGFVPQPERPDAQRLT